MRISQPVTIEDLEALSDAINATGLPGHTYCVSFDEHTEAEFSVTLTVEQIGMVVQLLNDYKLNEARIRKHDERNTARLKAETGGFLYPDANDNIHRVQTDRDSILRMTQAAMAAMSLGDSFTAVWVCEDDYGLPLDANGMITLQLAFVQHGQACHTNSQIIKAAINICTTAEQIESVDVTSGWPA